MNLVQFLFSTIVTKCLKSKLAQKILINLIDVHVENSKNKIDDNVVSIVKKLLDNNPDIKVELDMLHKILFKEPQ